MNPKKKNLNFLKATSQMSLATFLSRILGLIREQVFAYFFGAGQMTDAFQVAFRIPNVFRDLFAEGVMSTALISVFTQTRLKQGTRRAWRVAGLVLRSLFLIVSGMALLGILLSPFLIDLYAHSYRLVSWKFHLTLRMTRFMFLFFPCIALAAAFMGILNACQVFFLPAFASGLFNLTLIGVGVFFVFLFQKFESQWGIYPIEGMVFGVLAGGLVQAFSQLPALYRAGYFWPEKNKDDPPWYRDSDLKKIFKLMLPGMIGFVAAQLSILVNTNLAIMDGSGAVSWLHYAFRLLQFPIGVFGVSLANVTLPLVCQHWVNQDQDQFREAITRSLKMSFAVSLPCTFGLIFLGSDVIALIFQYGKFSLQDTRATAWALGMYAIGLSASIVVKLLVSVYYALGNIKIPIISSILAISIMVGFNLFFFPLLGYGGLALGSSVAALGSASLLLGYIPTFFSRYQLSFSFTPIMKSFFAYLFLSFFMGLCFFFTRPILEQLWIQIGWVGEMGTSKIIIRRVGTLGIFMVEGMFLYYGGAKILRLEEMNALLEMLKRKI